MSFSESSKIFWGCELRGDKQEYTWTYNEWDGMDHKLSICHASISATAVDSERNVVEATCDNVEDGTISTYTIFSLKLGLIETISLKLNFTTSMTLKLVLGSGPVHLVGYRHASIEYEDFKEATTDEEELSAEDPLRGNIPNFEAARVHTEIQKLQDPMPKYTSISDGSWDEDEEHENNQDFCGSEEEKVNEIATIDENNVDLKTKYTTNFNDEGKTEDNFVIDKIIISESSKSLNFEEIKKEIGSIPNLPTSRKKFNNFMRSNLKIFDVKMINDTWRWLLNTRK